MAIVSRVEQELYEKRLIVLQTDKSGLFGVLPRAEFRKKRDEAVDNLLVPFTGDIRSLKLKVLSLLKENDMPTLVKEVRNSAANSFSNKFLLKDHKPDMPLRIVLNENQTWQKVISKFIQKSLSVLDIPNSISLKNSEEFIAALQPFHGSKVHVMSLDVKDLYYSLRKPLLLSRVQDFLLEDLVRFQSHSGLAISDFMRLLDLYLQSTVTCIDDVLFTQRDGVFIGSSIAPILSEIYLNVLDSAVSGFLNQCGEGLVLVSRFVDDIIIVSRDMGMFEAAQRVVKGSSPELVFTSEQPSKGRLQFLDLQLHVEQGLCWEYGKMKCKPILHAKSCHSKLVKAGVVGSLIQSSLKKSCFHFVDDALRRQVDRLCDAGYSRHVIDKMLLKQFFFARSAREAPGTSVVVPYYHKLSHNLKAIADNHNVKLLFRNNYRLDRLTPFSKASVECGINHRTLHFVPCIKNVVYSIPLGCGFEYIGQTSQCLNVRLGQHRNDPDSNLADHLKMCKNCKPLWQETSVLDRQPIARKRLLREAVAIQSSGRCVSEESVNVHPTLRKLFSGL